MPAGGHHMASGILALNPSPTAALGEMITFTWSAEGLHGQQQARIQVLAYQDVDGDGALDDLVYAWADWADAGFLLGGGNSQWLINGGPAKCHADLGFFDNHGHWNTLDTIEFDAAG